MTTIYKVLTAAVLYAATFVAPAVADAIGGRAESSIVNREGDVIGTARFVQGNEGVVVEIQVAGLPPGKRGMHFHHIGICEGDTQFKSAEGHIMPTGRPHGYLNEKGPHAGNLTNLIVHEDGSAHVELYTELVSVNGRGGLPALLDENGSALIIHANEDDHTTQPIGGSGGRIACGVIKPLE